MFIIQWTFFISNSQELQARRCLRETVCVIYHFIGEMIFCWNDCWHGFLKSTRGQQKNYLTNIYDK